MARRRRPIRDDDTYRDEVSAPPAPRDLRTAMEVLNIRATTLATNMLEELGMSCGGASYAGAGYGAVDDRDVPGGESPFDQNTTVDDVRELIEQGNQLNATPWGTNATNNRSYYTVDTGHMYVVKPRAQGQTTSPSVERVQDWLKGWLEEMDWPERQSECMHRLDKHGEAIDLLYYDPNGRLKLGWVEPWDLDDDPSSPFIDDSTSDKPFIDRLGIRRTNNSLFRNVAYYVTDGGASGQWIGDLHYHGTMPRVLANFNSEFSPGQDTLLQYRRRNALSGDPRGLTFYWPVRDELRWAKLLLKNLMQVSAFQATFGAIRTLNAAAGGDAVKSFLQSSNSGGANDQAERMDWPGPAVVTVPNSIKYEFPETGAGNSNHIDVLVQLLRAASAGMMLPEFMLTANVGEGNFASTLVSEGPFHKAMRREQNRLANEDLRLIWQALAWAAANGQDGLSAADLEAVVIEAKPPRIQTRNRVEDFEIGKGLYELGLKSGKTLAAQEGDEFEQEQAQIQRERSIVMPPLTENPQQNQQTGPDGRPMNRADSMREPGVMSGDPGRNSPANR